MLQLLRSGQISALILDAPFVEYQAAVSCDLYLVGDIVLPNSLAFAFPPDTDLVSRCWQASPAHGCVHRDQWERTFFNVCLMWKEGGRALKWGRDSMSTRLIPARQLPTFALLPLPGLRPTV
jgi:hypothetical protein